MYEPPQYPPPGVPSHAPPTATLEPVPVSPLRRAGAWGIDFGLMVLVAVGLGFLTYKRIISPFSGVASEARSGFREATTSGAAVGGETLETLSEVWGEVSGLVIQGFLALVVLQFLYQFIGIAWPGRTLGKMVLDIRVVVAASDTEKTKPSRGRAARRATVTTIVDTGLFSLACCVLLSGQFVLSVLCWLVAVLAFWSNALPTLVGKRLSLADMAAGTTVSGGALYRAVAMGVTHGSQAAASHIAQGARGLSEHERVKQVWESQRAQQMRQTGQDAASRIAEQARGVSESERVKQVLESQPAQQVRQVSQGAAERGRKAWDRLKKTTQQPQSGSPTAPGTVPPPASGQLPHPPTPGTTGYPTPGYPPAPGHPGPPPDVTPSPYTSADHQPEPAPGPDPPSGYEPPPR